MQIHQIRLHNFKQFEDSVFQFHPKFTVLIGDNGKGKTSILDALAILMSSYFIGSGIITGRPGIKQSEVRFVLTEKEELVFAEPQKNAYLIAKGRVHEKTLTWRRDPKDRGGNAKEIMKLANQAINAASQGQDQTLPLLLYYGAGRLWNLHRNVEIGKPESRLIGYRNCLDPHSDQYLFEKWFRQLEMSSFQKGKKIPALEAVRKAILCCIPDSEYFYYDIGYGQILIRLQEKGLIPFNALSDGYRNMVAMVADIVHRASRLNPHLGIDVSAKIEGIVLIDEIDLHLHPKWQRQVVGDLQKVFPQIQFIATTHSPFILQSLEPGEVIDLNQETYQEIPAELANQDLALPAPAESFSNRSIEDITEEVMGVEVPQRSEKYQEMYDTAKEYYRLLEQGKSQSDSEKINTIKQKLDELSAPFSDNVAYHAFLEMERMAAGLGSSEISKKRRQAQRKKRQPQFKDEGCQ